MAYVPFDSLVVAASHSTQITLILPCVPTRLANGTYAMACGGVPVHLKPTGHTGLITSSTRTQHHHTHPTLGAPSSVNVSLVVATPGTQCTGTKVIATFAYYQNTGAVIFTQTFPDGVTNDAGPALAHAGDGDGGDGGDAVVPAPVDVNVAATDAVAAAGRYIGGNGTCTLQHNTDFHGNDITFVANITDPGTIALLSTRLVALALALMLALALALMLALVFQSPKAQP